MKSRLVTRNVTIHGHRTSLRLQMEIWDALAEICHREQMSLNDLCSLIDERCSGSNRTSAVRAFAVTYFRAAQGATPPSATLVEGDEDSIHSPLARIGRSFRDLRVELAKLAGVRPAGQPAPQHREVLRLLGRLRAEVLGFLAETDDVLRSADPLTGLPGRSGMFRLVERERVVVDVSKPASIALIGLDQVDLLSDNSGDVNRIVTKAASYLLENMRQHDELCRADARSLALVMPRTAPEKAKRVLDRIRRGLARSTLTLEDGSEATVTMSVGIAPILSHESSEQAIAHAESAMRLARGTGRNRVRTWREGEREDEHRGLGLAGSFAAYQRAIERVKID